MNNNLYAQIKRLLAVLVSIALWSMSMKFSVSGFGIGNDKDMWMGWVLAFAVTAIELIWNGMKMKTNLTLHVLGVSAYLYGIVTNVLGVYIWRGGDLAQDVNVMALLFALALGILIEIAPEPLFIWGVLGSIDEGDFLGNLLQNGSISPQEGPRSVSVAPPAYPPRVPAYRPKSYFNKPR